MLDWCWQVNLCLGSPVHLLVYVDIYSASHMTVHLFKQTWSRSSSGKKCKTADLLVFSNMTISRQCFTDANGQTRIVRLLQADRMARGTYINAHYDRRMQRSIYDLTNSWSRWTTGAEDHIGCHSCQLRNRKPRLQFTQDHQNEVIEDWKTVACTEQCWFLLFVAKTIY